MYTFIAQPIFLNPFSNSKKTDSNTLIWGILLYITNHPTANTSCFTKIISPHLVLKLSDNLGCLPMVTSFMLQYPKPYFFSFRCPLYWSWVLTPHSRLPNYLDASSLCLGSDIERLVTFPLRCLITLHGLWPLLWDPMALLCPSWFWCLLCSTWPKSFRANGFQKERKTEVVILVSVCISLMTSDS